MSQVNGKLQKVPAGYKKTEIGVIPNDWLCIESSDAINYFGGYGFSSRLAVSSGIKWLKIANVGLNEIKWDAESFLPVYLTLEHKRFELSLDDVVMALTRPILSNKLKVARIGLDDIPSLLNQRVARLEAKSFHEIDFLYYVVQRLNFVSAMNLAMAGTDPPNIGTVALGKIKIATPSNKAEQTAIANALSDVDALITSLEKLIVKKRAIKTAAMQQLLTGKKRLPPFDTLNIKDGTPRYKQTELGEIPRDWVMTQFGQMITELKGGANFSPSDFSVDGVPVIPKSGVTWGGILKIRENDLQFCRENIAKKFISNLIDQSFSVIVLRDLVPSGPNIGLIVVIEEPKQYLLAQGVYAFKLKAEYGAQYLAQLSNSSKYRKLMQSILVGSTQVHIRSSTLKETRLAVPSSKEEQDAIACVLSDMDKEIDALENRLNKTQQIKQGMMQELLTGRTRLV